MPLNLVCAPKNSIGAQIEIERGRQIEEKAWLGVDFDVWIFPLDSHQRHRSHYDLLHYCCCSNELVESAVSSWGWLEEKASMKRMNTTF